MRGEGDGMRDEGVPSAQAIARAAASGSGVEKTSPRDGAGARVQRLLTRLSARSSGRADERSLAGVMAVLVLLLLVAVTVALCVGRYEVPPLAAFQILVGQVVPLDLSIWPDAMHDVVLKLRLPRVLAAILVGGALALAGATYQGIFKNPLVSPDLLGVSSGACVGAAVSILLGLGLLSRQVFAFVGGVVAVALTMAIPRIMRRDSTIMLVLSGVIVGGFMGSIIGLIKYIADAETQLPDIVYWQLGSLAKVNMSTVCAIAPVMLVTAGVLFAMRWRVNLLSLGDQDAKTLGVNLRRERGVAVACATILTACAVCLSGTIGWIGLVMPHVARRLVGTDNRRTFPVAVVSSAIFLLVIDTLARTLTGGELPLGILTGFIGAPFFALILVRERMQE